MYCLGPQGSFSHECAMRQYSLEIVCKDTIADVFRATQEGGLGLVPLENSIFGSVQETLDCLASTSDIQIVAESFLTIEHCLLSNSTLPNIQRVYSHPQAIGQCKAWLQKHLPKAELINASSTSKAAELAALETGAASISSEKCASLYGLTVIAGSIQSNLSSNWLMQIIQRGLLQLVMNQVWVITSTAC
jgi:chorismate mutase/prephenate dehydratase